MSFRHAVCVLVTLGISASAVLACKDDAPGGTSSGATSSGGTSGGETSSGGTSSGGPLDPGTPAPAGAAGDFCRNTFGVVVGALETCCTAEDKATHDYLFIGGIAARLLPVCTSTLQASVAKGRVLWRAPQGDACYAAYRSTYGTGACANLTNTYSDPAGTACREAFVGIGAAGAACMGDHECIDGLTCVGYTNDVDGACKAPPPIGDPCGPGRSDAGSSFSSSLEFGSHPSCAADARCDSLRGECIKAAAGGETCTSDETCVAPLHCVLGTCGPNGPAGESGPCLNQDDCMPDLYCQGATGTTKGSCKKKRTAGGACTGAVFVTECSGRCAASPGQPGQCTSFCGSP